MGDHDELKSNQSHFLGSRPTGSIFPIVKLPGRDPREHRENADGGGGDRPESGQAKGGGEGELKQDLKEVLKDDELQFPVRISFSLFMVEGNQIFGVFWQVQAFLLVEEVGDQSSDSEWAGGTFRFVETKGAYNLNQERHQNWQADDCKVDPVIWWPQNILIAQIVFANLSY